MMEKMSSNDVKKILRNGDEGFDLELVKNFFKENFSLNRVAEDLMDLVEDEKLEEYILNQIAKSFSRKELIDEWRYFIEE